MMLTSELLAPTSRRTRVRHRVNASMGGAPLLVEMTADEYRIVQAIQDRDPMALITAARTVAIQYRDRHAR